MDLWKIVVLAGLLHFLLVPVPELSAAEDNESGSMVAMLSMGLEELVDLEVELATGSLKPIRLAPAVASVITAEQIENMGATTLDEVLETVPGLHVYPSNVQTMDSMYSIRGIHTSLNPQVLLLVNNIPVTYGLTGGRPAQFMLPIAMISRVEIVRGPGSAIHGADAFAGTINVITKDGFEIDGTRSGLRYGSFETYDAWLQHGRQYNGWDVAISLEYQKSNGDKNRKIDSDTQTMFDGMFGTSSSLAPGSLDLDYEFWDGHLTLTKDNWTVRAWGMLQPEGTQADGVTQTLSTLSHTEQKMFLGDITYNNGKLFKDTNFTLKLSHLYAKDDVLVQLFPAGAVLPVGADGNLFTGENMVRFTDGVIGTPGKVDNHTIVDLTLFYEGVNRHKFRCGSGFKNIRAEFNAMSNFGPGVLDNPVDGQIVDGTLTATTNTPYIYVPDTTRKVGYVSLQDEWSIANGWELTGGVRYDHYSDFGHTINPRLALVWETRYDLTSKVMYGRAFRPPSFSELYSQNNPATIGNKDLEPETVDTYELAIEYQPTSNLFARLNLFAYEIENLIELDGARQQNNKNQEGQGFEMEAAWQTTKELLVRVNFAYQRSKDKETEEITPDAPEVQFFANTHWKFMPNWSLDGQYYWIGKRHRANGDTRPAIKDNDVVNITLRCKNIAGNWDAALAVRNVFDEDIREPSQSSIPNDYPMEGRAIWGEVRWSY